MRIRTPQRRGFTYAEAIVVIVVLLAVSAAVVPRFGALEKSRKLLDVEGDIARLPSQAANEAIALQSPVRLRLDGPTLVLEKDPVGATPTLLKQVPLGDQIQVVDVQSAGQPALSGSWQWMVYPDGSADNAAIQFRIGDRPQALVLESNGGSRWFRGSLVEGEPTWWPAGNFRPGTQ